MKRRIIWTIHLYFWGSIPSVNFPGCTGVTITHWGSTRVWTNFGQHKVASTKASWVQYQLLRNRVSHQRHQLRHPIKDFDPLSLRRLVFLGGQWWNWFVARGKLLANSGRLEHLGVRDLFLNISATASMNIRLSHMRWRLIRRSPILEGPGTKMPFSRGSRHWFLTMVYTMGHWFFCVYGSIIPNYTPTSDWFCKKFSGIISKLFHYLTTK